MCDDVTVKRCALHTARQGLRSAGDAQPLEKHALRRQSGMRRARGNSRGCQWLEIHMGGQIGFAGRGQRIDRLVTGDRLQRVAL